MQKYKGFTNFQTLLYVCVHLHQRELCHMETIVYGNNKVQLWRVTHYSPHCINSLRAAETNSSGCSQLSPSSCQTLQQQYELFYMNVDLCLTNITAIVTLVKEELATTKTGWHNHNDNFYTDSISEVFALQWFCHSHLQFCISSKTLNNERLLLWHNGWLVHGPFLCQAGMQSDSYLFIDTMKCRTLQMQFPLK